MTLQDRLNRLQTNLESFDLEAFFHDDTFLEISDDREYIQENLNSLSFKQKEALYFIDEIIWSYYNLYKDRELTGYAKLSFSILSEIAKISLKNIEKAAA